jgi:hypothetical protein
MQFFSFGIAPSMFPQDCQITRKGMTAEQVKVMEADLTPALNPSHKASIDAMRSRFGIDVEIPEKAPIVSLADGDSVVVMGISGLPRLENRHEYTDEEIASAKFSFSIFTVAVPTE